MKKSRLQRPVQMSLCCGIIASFNLGHPCLVIARAVWSSHTYPLFSCEYLYRVVRLSPNLGAELAGRGRHALWCRYRYTYTYKSCIRIKDVDGRSSQGGRIFGLGLRRREL